VRRKNGHFSSRSTAPCGSSFRARELDERLGLSALVQRQAVSWITWSLNREFKMEIPINPLESSA